MSKIFLFILFGFFSLPLWSQSYTKGRYVCEDFSTAERNYKNSPTNIFYLSTYATCLVLKGEDEKGMSFIHLLADKYKHVFSAFLIADYTANRDLTPIQVEQWEEEKVIDETISAYERVLSLINREQDYPDQIYWSYELGYQLELNSYAQIPFLYSQKFQAGFYGLENHYLTQSPGYKGDKTLNTYPEHNPYTEESLKKMQDTAKLCASLPRKAHFKHSIYGETMEYCQKLKEIAENLIPLEKKRLELLQNETCHKELSDCKDYLNIRDQMLSILF